MITAVNVCGTTSSELDNIVISASFLATGNISGDTVVCPGDGAVYTIDSIAGATYLWTYADTIYQATVQPAVTVAFGYERANATLQVVAINECAQSIPTFINIAIDTVRVSITQSGNTLYATNIPGYTYQWYLGTAEISNATQSSYAFTTGGAYNVAATSPSGCQTADAYNAILIGINDSQNKEARIYPNPIKCGDILQLPQANQLKVYNSLGALVYEAQQVQQINTAAFAAGIYVLFVDGNVAKLIVE